MRYGWNNIRKVFKFNDLFIPVTRRVKWLTRFSYDRCDLGNYRSYKVGIKHADSRDSMHSLTLK